MGEHYHPTDRLLHEILEEVREIRRELKPHHYTVTVTQETPMAIVVGSTGTFAAQLQDNGANINLPSGSTFAWTASDAGATIAPSADTLSAVVTIPAGDTNTTVTITATTTAPDGTSVNGSLAVAVTPQPQKFTVVVTQTA